MPLFRPSSTDLRVILYYMGRVIIGVGLLMLLPLMVGVAYQEWNAVIDFAIGATTCFVVGQVMSLGYPRAPRMGWAQGMVIASASWLIAMLLGAVPHYLSGHFLSYLDASFDLMSGYTTTGLYLLQDLDHISNALNMWRHLLTYAGGQGIVVVALTFLVRGSGLLKMYVGEAKEEQLLPNVIETARAIWLISLIYLVVGSLFLWGATWYEGMRIDRAFLHGIWLFMGAWSTGGFAPQSQNILYYHSLVVEIATLSIFVIGSFNFALHYAVWEGDRREIYRNIEIVSFTVTMTAAFLLLMIGLSKAGVYPDAMSFMRKAFYNLISGHTTTGNQTIYAAQFLREWGPYGIVVTSIAMAIGGSAASTAGGVKGLRMGIIAKAMLLEVKKLLLPESAVIKEKTHHIKDTVLTDDILRMAALIALLYVFSYSLGTVVGVYYGYHPAEALFESVSAGSNTGLSTGVTAATMPGLLKVVYIFEMWTGRMEFISVLALFGFVVSLVRGK